jgi:hypothetical protein
MIASLSQIRVRVRKPVARERLSLSVSSDLKRRLEAVRHLSLEYIPNDAFEEMPAEASLTSEVQRAMAHLPVALPKKKAAATKSVSPLARACEMPLLAATEERALFERLNHVKFLVNRRLLVVDAQSPTVEDVETIEQWLNEVHAVRNRIVGANVRLVISIVKTFVDLKNPFD